MLKVIDPERLLSFLRDGPSVASEAVAAATIEVELAVCPACDGDKTIRRFSSRTYSYFKQRCENCNATGVVLTEKT